VAFFLFKSVETGYSAIVLCSIGTALLGRTVVVKPTVRDAGVEVLTHARRRILRHPVSVRVAQTFRLAGQLVAVGTLVEHAATEVRAVALMPAVGDRCGRAASPR